MGSEMRDQSHKRRNVERPDELSPIRQAANELLRILGPDAGKVARPPVYTCYGLKGQLDDVREEQDEIGRPLQPLAPIYVAPRVSSGCRLDGLVPPFDGMTTGTENIRLSSASQNISIDDDELSNVRPQFSVINSEDTEGSSNGVVESDVGWKSSSTISDNRSDIELPRTAPVVYDHEMTPYEHEPFYAGAKDTQDACPYGDSGDEILLLDALTGEESFCQPFVSTPVQSPQAAMNISQVISSIYGSTTEDSSCESESLETSFDDVSAPEIVDSDGTSDVDEIRRRAEHTPVNLTLTARPRAPSKELSSGCRKLRKISPKSLQEAFAVFQQLPETSVVNEKPVTHQQDVEMSQRSPSRELQLIPANSRLRLTSTPVQEIGDYLPSFDASSVRPLDDSELVINVSREVRSDEIHAETILSSTSIMGVEPASDQLAIPVEPAADPAGADIVTMLDTSAALKGDKYDMPNMENSRTKSDVPSPVRILVGCPTPGNSPCRPAVFQVEASKDSESLVQQDKRNIEEVPLVVNEFQSGGVASSRHSGMDFVSHAGVVLTPCQNAACISRSFPRRYPLENLEMNSFRHVDRATHANAGTVTMETECDVDVPAACSTGQQILQPGKLKSKAVKSHGSSRRTGELSGVNGKTHSVAVNDNAFNPAVVASHGSSIVKSLNTGRQTPESDAVEVCFLTTAIADVADLPTSVHRCVLETMSTSSANVSVDDLLDLSV